MSVGKQEKPENCPMPVYWVLGNGIVTFPVKTPLATLSTFHFPLSTTLKGL
jgi:hypothetical protein